MYLMHGDIPPQCQYKLGSSDYITHKTHHIARQVRPDLQEPRICSDVSSHRKADSRVNQTSRQSIAQLHPESNITPTMQSHACVYLHPIKTSVTLRGLSHIYINI